MSHHSPQHPNEKFAEILEKLPVESLEARFNEINESLSDSRRGMDLGPTGEHPDGILTPSDEGGLQYRIGSKAGKVVLDFGKPVVWIGFNPEGADGLWRAIKKHTRRARAQRLSESS